jgi:hypothetical protein
VTRTPTRSAARAQRIAELPMDPTRPPASRVTSVPTLGLARKAPPGEGPRSAGSPRCTRVDSECSERSEPTALIPRPAPVSHRPACVVPVAAIVRCVIRDDHEVAQPDGDLLLATGAEIRLHSLVRLDAGDGHRSVYAVHSSKSTGDRRRRRWRVTGGVGLRPRRAGQSDRFASSNCIRIRS